MQSWQAANYKNRVNVLVVNVVIILVVVGVTASCCVARLGQVTPLIALAQLNFIKESTCYIHNKILGISNCAFT